MLTKENKKPKILFILHLPPPVHGAANVGLQIKNSISINNIFDGTYINLSTSRSVDEIGKCSFKKIIRYISIFGQVLKNIIFKRYQFCYMSITTKSPPFYKDAFLAIMIKLFNIKVLYHLHNKGVSEQQHLLLNNFLYRLVFKNSGVILLSEYLYPDIAKYVHKDRIFYCANGIQKVKEQANKYVPNDRVKILFLSNLLIAKGIYVLLESLSILKSKNINFKCTFVGGEGDVDRQHFEERVKALELEAYVEYVGKKFGEEKDTILRESDLFVHPTLNDCFPLVLLEAMQFSLPVISTLEGGIPDIVENNLTGFLVGKNEVKMLATKLDQLISKPELRLQMGKAGKLKMEEQFTLQKFENNLINIFRSYIQ